MLNPLLYHDVYLMFVSFMTIVILAYYHNQIISEKGKNSSLYIGIVLTFAVVFFVGYRPIHEVFQDTIAYAFFYNKHEGLPFNFTFDEDNVIFNAIFHYVASLRLGYSVFFTIIALIYFGGILFSGFLLFKKHGLLAFVTYLAAFSTYSYSVNGIKAGAAASVFLIGLGYMENNKKILAWLFVLISFGFHHSMVMCIAAFALVFIYNKNSKVYFAGWIFCFIIAALHVSAFQNFFGHLLADNEDKGASYLLNNGISTGFRIDFILYSSMPVIVGYIAKYKKRIQSKSYDFLLHIYLVTNSIWMLCMYANFTNRIAYLSWFMYPFVLLYPFLGRDCIWGASCRSTLIKVVFFHLLFTLAMHYIYYA